MAANRSVKSYSEIDLEAQISHLSDDSNEFDRERYFNHGMDPVSLSRQVTSNSAAVNAAAATTGRSSDFLSVSNPRESFNLSRQVTSASAGADVAYNAYTARKSRTSASEKNNGLVYSITTSGTANEFIHIDDKKFLKEDLVAAFGGTFNPGYSEKPPYRFANPSPLGLCAFAMTTFVLSLVNLQTRGVVKPNIVVGLAMFYGGFIQLLAGMWEIVLCNPFGATSLSSFGGFWMSYAAIQIDFFGIAKAYEDSPGELDNAIGFFLLGWTIFTFGLVLLTMKSTVAFFSVFFTLLITFALLTAAKFANSVACDKAAGVFGITAPSVLGTVPTRVWPTENSYIQARAIPLPYDVFAKKKY